ncbi:hypothetical protein SOVF_131440 [Spinacia oleracea]|nr:hypothetical protein SOVF_131440 [Spinacia oleracea]
MATIGYFPFNSFLSVVLYCVATAVLVVILHKAASVNVGVSNDIFKSLYLDHPKVESGHQSPEQNPGVIPDVAVSSVDTDAPEFLNTSPSHVHPNA